MSDMKETFRKYIEDHKDEMLKDLFDLIRIDSSADTSVEGKPYGIKPYTAFKAAMELCEKYGFSAESLENKVFLAEYEPGLPVELDMIAHVDVVPGGSGWTETEPFDPVIKDGIIYGRGCSDDKGGMIALLYAMRALKESGVKLKKEARMIIGNSEETNMRDIHWYYDHYEEAPFTFTADAGFPVNNVEKGRLEAYFDADYVPASEPGTTELIRFEGGNAPNQIPPYAFALLKGVKCERVEEAAGKIAQETGVRLEVSEEDGNVKIEAFGKSSHGARPHLGKNSVLALLKLVLEVSEKDSELIAKLRKIYAYFPFGDFAASYAGLAQENEITGPTTCSLNMLKAADGHVRVSIDSRTAAELDGRDLPAEMEIIAKECGFTLFVKERTLSHIVPEDNPYVQILLNCYSDVLGKPGRTSAIGGSSYVHSLKRGVVFGVTPDGFQPNAHGPNEQIEVQALLDGVVIYAEAILKICG